MALKAGLSFSYCKLSFRRQEESDAFLLTPYALSLTPVFIYIYSETPKWVGTLKKYFLTDIYSMSYKRKYFGKCFTFG